MTRARSSPTCPKCARSWFFAVPRIWEKLKAGPGDDDRRPARGAARAHARRRSTRGDRARCASSSAASRCPPSSPSEVARADAEIFAGLRAMLGLDQVEAINVGAAPTPVEVLEFFHAIGLPLAELWGMSETCGAGSVNPTDKIKIGTVGPPAPGVRDQARQRRRGARQSRRRDARLPQPAREDQPRRSPTTAGCAPATSAQFDEDGYLKIVDRKKELIISAAGKNMSPANIEATLKTASPLIGQACCIGDGRPYNTALIVLDADFAPAWAAQQGIEDDLAGGARARRARARGRAGGRRRRQREARASRTDQEASRSSRATGCPAATS